MQTRLSRAKNPAVRALTGARTARAPLGCSKLPIADEASVRAGCSARVDLHQTLADMEIVHPTETKAVLEHRAPKASPPILHTRCAESKVGRAVHCAPVWIPCKPSFSAGILPSAPLRARLRRATLWGAVNYPLPMRLRSEPGAAHVLTCTKLWTTWKSSLQSNRKRC